MRACCRALGKTEDAIMHYTERIRLGGWEEECFMSALNIANLVKKQWENGQIISSQVSARQALNFCCKHILST